MLQIRVDIKTHPEASEGQGSPSRPSIVAHDAGHRAQSTVTLAPGPGHGEPGGLPPSSLPSSQWLHQDGVLAWGGDRAHLTQPFSHVIFFYNSFKLLKNVPAGGSTVCLSDQSYTAGHYLIVDSFNGHSCRSAARHVAAGGSGLLMESKPTHLSQTAQGVPGRTQD